MALAGRAHVVVARQAQFHRALRFVREHRRDAGNERGLALLAAEGAAHAPHLHRDGIERNAEQMPDRVLDLGRMLGRREDVEVAAVARNRERDLAFEIEMILPAAMQFALEAMRRRFQRARRHRRAS